MRAAHNRADDAVDSGFHAIDRQLKTAGEIIAGTRPGDLVPRFRLSAEQHHRHRR